MRIATGVISLLILYYTASADAGSPGGEYVPEMENQNGGSTCNCRCRPMVNVRSPAKSDLKCYPRVIASSGNVTIPVSDKIDIVLLWTVRPATNDMDFEFYNVQPIENIKIIAIGFLKSLVGADEDQLVGNAYDSEFMDSITPDGGEQRDDTDEDNNVVRSYVGAVNGTVVRTTVTRKIDRTYIDDYDFLGEDCPYISAFISGGMRIFNTRQGTPPPPETNPSFRESFTLTSPTCMIERRSCKYMY